MTIEIEHRDAIIIEYSSLLNGEDLSESIKESLGDEFALGVVLVRNIPNYIELRERLLTTIPKLADLPTEALNKYEVPETKWWIGWSHGKELRASDKMPDTNKGSFYFNPIFDSPGTLEERKNDINLWHPNVWPSEVEEFEPVCKAMAKLMVSVGKLVARQCDSYCEKSIADYIPGTIEQVVGTSRCHKARALHYFPSIDQVQTAKDNLCGWHLDNSMLTALTRPLYNGNGKFVESDDSGLFIKTRDGKIASVSIPKDCLAFQTGEALQIFTNDMIKATPHCVSSSKELSHLSRNTLAIFMQPESEFQLKNDFKFKDFCQDVLKRHH